MREQTIHLDEGSGEFPCFIVRPDAPNAPGLILIEEIWGVTDHIRDVARRFAREGYVVLAPELLGDSGVLETISPAIFADMHDPAKRDAAQARMREALAPIREPAFAVRAVARLKACYGLLAQDPQVARIGVAGFCFGGTFAFALAAAEPGIAACVPFYGHPPGEQQLARIACPVLAFYGERDENLMKTLPELTAAMEREGKDFTAKVYPGAGHAFFNDTNARMYDKPAATDAWTRTLAFLKRHLKD